MRKWRVYNLLTLLVLGIFASQVLARVPGYTVDYGGDSYWVESNTMIDNFASPTVAVALGGGGARALVNVGVLKALDEEGIPVDLVIGTSMGAVVAVMYGSGIPVDQIERLVTQVDLAGLFDLNFPFTKSLVDPAGLNSFLEQVAPVKRLEEFPIPTALLSFELNEGIKYIQTTGPISSAVQGAYAIPFCFPGQEVNGSFLIDAGIQELTPAKAAKALGAEVVISITAFDELPYSVYDNSLRSFMRMINLIKEDFSQEVVHLYSDVVIAHDVGKYSFMDFQLAQDFINLGYARTREEMPRIKQALVDNSVPLCRSSAPQTAIDLDAWLLDAEHDRFDLGQAVLKPRLYIGQKYSPLAATGLFREAHFASHWGLEAKFRTLRADVLGDFQDAHAEAQLRWARVLPKIDLLTRLATKDNESRAEVLLQGYGPQGTTGFGVFGFGHELYLHVFGSYGQSEAELLWGWEEKTLEYLVSHRLAFPVSNRWGMQAAFGVADTKYLVPAPMYPGQAIDSGPLAQTLIGLSHRAQFGYSVEVLQLIQVTGIDQQVFWWGGRRKEDWQSRFGAATSLEFNLLGLKPSLISAYLLYAPTTSETRGGLEVNISL